MFTLVYTRDGEVRRHALSAGDTVVGRAAVCDLAIDDPSISRRHARFRIHGNHCVVTDLGGRNGTFIDGELVSEAEVRAGSTVVLGRFPLQVEHSAPVPALLSNHRSLLASPHALFKRVDSETETGSGEPTTASPERLLLLLSAISRQLVRRRPLPSLLERVLAVAFEAVAVDRASLRLVDEATGEFLPYVCRRRDGTEVAPLSLSPRLLRKVIDDRVAVLASDAAVDTHEATAPTREGEEPRSFICTPLWTQEAVIGVLCADNPESSPLTAADLDVLQALSAYAAIAIEQARSAP